MVQRTIFCKFLGPLLLDPIGGGGGLQHLFTPPPSAPKPPSCIHLQYSTLQHYSIFLLCKISGKIRWLVSILQCFRIGSSSLNAFQADVIHIVIAPPHSPDSTNHITVIVKSRNTFKNFSTNCIRIRIKFDLCSDFFFTLFICIMNDFLQSSCNTRTMFLNPMITFLAKNRASSSSS